MRCLFFGTPEFAVPSLRALSQSVEVAAVVCQPDKPKGRGKKLQAPPTKLFAQELRVPVHQPAKLRSEALLEELRRYNADVAVVVAYGRILPPAILEMNPSGCVNVHASLLPRWRGAAPIQWALASGDATTGISLMQLDEGMDTGPVFSHVETPIRSNETAGDLSLRLAELGASHLTAQLPKIVSGDLKAEAQPDAGVTHARLLTKTDGVLDFSGTAKSVVDRVRGMNPWPGGMTWSGAERIRVHKAHVVAEDTNAGVPGQVLPGSEESLLVACGVGVVALEELQLDGKRRVGAADFLRGHTLASGSILKPTPNH